MKIPIGNLLTRFCSKESGVKDYVVIWTGSPENPQWWCRIRNPDWKLVPMDVIASAFPFCEFDANGAVAVVLSPGISQSTEPEIKKQNDEQWNRMIDMLTL